MKFEDCLGKLSSMKNEVGEEGERGRGKRGRGKRGRGEEGRGRCYFCLVYEFFIW